MQADVTSLFLATYPRYLSSITQVIRNGLLVSLHSLAREAVRAFDVFFVCVLYERRHIMYRTAYATHAKSHKGQMVGWTGTT